MGQSRHTSWGTAHLVHTKYTTNAWELQPVTKEATRDGATCHAQSSSVCGPVWVDNTTVVNPHAQWRNEHHCSPRVRHASSCECFNVTKFHFPAFFRFVQRTASSHNVETRSLAPPRQLASPTGRFARLAAVSALSLGPEQGAVRIARNVLL